VQVELLDERERLQTECFNADTPYSRDGIMNSFKCSAAGGGSYTLDPKTRYVKAKYFKG
jgi:hypothetical protein